MNNFLDKFSSVVEKYLSPITGKVAQNKYLQIIATSFMTILPIILIGSFSLILSRPFLDYNMLEPNSVLYGFFKAWAQFSEVYGPYLSFLFGITLGSQALYLSLAIAYNTALKNDMNTFLTMLVAFISFLLINSQYVQWNWDTSYFGGTGLFSAIITTFVSVELYHWFVKKKLGYINFPDTVPASLRNSLGNLVPITLIFIIMLLGRILLAEGFNTSFPEIMMALGKPLNLAVDTIWGISLSSTFAQIGWWFGIHSSAILSVVMPSLEANTLENAAAYAAGASLKQLPRIVTSPFYFNFVAIGGGGATLGLVFLMLRSKSKQIQTIGKLAIVPGIFGINEPVLFGLPIVLNPIFLIPFLLAQIVNIILCYVPMSMGLINRTFVNVSSTVPVGLGQLLSSLDYKSLILTVVCIIADVIVYYPFFKVYEKQKLQEEANTSNLEDVDLEEIEVL
ncbi:PTS sugar transporter subunit IIC [Tepidanaerobacter syntrophicus]|uniref:PTS sugar transporter subunit IIC n=1 Tax=Tepidanaerobacter syntrophicus TaxID=224999 RepID=UPI001BD691EA